MPSEAEQAAPLLRRPKSRLIVRLGSFLVDHCFVVSLICCLSGFVALLILPLMAKNTYISENALVPGSANPIFSAQDSLEASKFIRDISHVKTIQKDPGSKMHGLLVQYMASVGAEVYFQKLSSQDDRFRPLRFFSCNSDAERQTNYTSLGINTVGIVRAPRGDGKEAIVLVTPYNAENVQAGEVLSLGLGFSIFSLLSRVDWLAKDIVWLAADSRFGEYLSVAEWLKDYHNPVFSTKSSYLPARMVSEVDFLQQSEYVLNGRDLNTFRRAGTMAAALVLKVAERREIRPSDRVTIYTEASNGQMSNLDLINTVHYLAVHRQGLSVKIGSLASLLDSRLLRVIGETLQLVVKWIESLNPGWKFGISSSDYVEGTATLASSLLHQAVGVPSGSHGAFRDYQVDAITLELSARDYPNDENGQYAFILKGGRLVEGVIRSVNNLLEKFHQSFFLYLLTAPNKFVSVGVYTIGFALLAAPLPIIAAALLSTSGEEPGEALHNWRWLCAAKVVLLVHSWAPIVVHAPFFISWLPPLSSTVGLLVWLALSVSLLLAMYAIAGSPYSHPSNDGWKHLKAVTVAAVSTGLGLMSIINFATAQIGALLLVPMCLMVRPLRLQTETGHASRALVLLLNVALVFVSFPPSALLLLGGGRGGIGVLWDWMELLWHWSSATFLYLALVHLPCWALCVHILFHP